MGGPRASLGDGFGVKNEVPESASGGLDLKLEPKEDRGPDGTLGGMVLSGVCVTGGLGSGLCSIFLGKSSVGELVERVLDDCMVRSGLGASPDAWVF